MLSGLSTPQRYVFSLSFEKGEISFSSFFGSGSQSELPLVEVLFRGVLMIVDIVDIVDSIIGSFFVYSLLISRAKWFSQMTCLVSRMLHIIGGGSRCCWQADGLTRSL